MILFAKLFDCVECLHFALFHIVTKSLKSCLSWEFPSDPYSSFGWEDQDHWNSWIANQIQWFKIPDRWEAGIKKGGGGRWQCSVIQDQTDSQTRLAIESNQWSKLITEFHDWNLKFGISRPSHFPYSLFDFQGLAMCYSCHFALGIWNYPYWICQRCQFGPPLNLKILISRLQFYRTGQLLRWNFLLLLFSRILAPSLMWHSPTQESLFKVFF